MEFFSTTLFNDSNLGEEPKSWPESAELYSAVMVNS